MAGIEITTGVSSKADVVISNPFPSYVKFENGDPISGGKIYFGMVSRDGEIPENRKKVYAILEGGDAVTIEQPVILSSGGVAQYNGNPVQLAIDGFYSIKILDSSDVLQYYADKVSSPSLLGYSGVIPEESKTVSGSFDIEFNAIEATTASFYASTTTDGSFFKGQYLRAGIDYTALNETTIRLITNFDAGTVILGRALDPTGQTVDVSNSTKQIFIFDTKSEAKEADLKVGYDVLINGGDALGDGKGGSYIVVAGGTGVQDDINYIDLNNGLQLKIKSLYQVFSSYSEKVQQIQSVSASLNIDLIDGNIVDVTLDASISSINVLNMPAVGEAKIQIQLKQNATGGNAVTWQVNGVQPLTAGGVMPSVTQDANAIDKYIITSSDAGATWQLYTIGQDLK